MSVRNSNAGKLLVQYQLAEELKQRQSKNQVAPESKGMARPNLIEDDEEDKLPPVAP